MAWFATIYRELWLWSLRALAPETLSDFCLGKPLLKILATPLPHSIPFLPVHLLWIHILLLPASCISVSGFADGRPRWLFTNGSSVICMRSQCLFWVGFFEAKLTFGGKKKYSLESNAFCSQFISFPYSFASHQVYAAYLSFKQLST